MLQAITSTLPTKNIHSFMMVNASCMYSSELQLLMKIDGLIKARRSKERIDLALIKQSIDMACGQLTHQNILAVRFGKQSTDQSNQANHLIDIKCLRLKRLAAKLYQDLNAGIKNKIDHYHYWCLILINMAPSLCGGLELKVMNEQVFPQYIGIDFQLVYQSEGFHWQLEFLLKKKIPFKLCRSAFCIENKPVVFFQLDDNGQSVAIDNTIHHQLCQRFEAEIEFLTKLAYLNIAHKHLNGEMSDS